MWRLETFLVVKRIMDILISLVGLTILLPLFILICVFITLDSPGSPFFLQVRVGRYEKCFRMIKFRSMYVNSNEQQSDTDYCRRMDAEGKIIKLQNDPRITRVGKILRTTSLDELPQLANVLIGHMSLVGPRALIPSMMAPYPEWAKRRSVVRPGITGLWQTSAREHNESLADMINYDLEYIHNWSLWKDIVILALTPKAVISGKGAV